MDPYHRPSVGTVESFQGEECGISANTLIRAVLRQSTFAQILCQINGGVTPL